MKNLIEKSEKFVVGTKIGKFEGRRFIPAELSEEEKQTLFEYTYFVALNAFIQNPSLAMEEDIYNHLFHEESLYVVFNRMTGWGATDDVRVVAFLSTRDIETSKGLMLYISGICVDPSFQGYGLGKALMDESFKKYDYHVASLRTQNPVMKESFDRSIGGCSHPNGCVPPKDVRDVAKELADVLQMVNFSENTLFDKKTYGTCLYGIEPTSKSDYYNDKFNEISKQAGDSMLCVKVF
jgi:ribosomal protein S18 acetylase RimI-like enzyme